MAVAALPKGAYATDLAVSGGEVLVTDVERFTVYTVNGSTLSVGEFGDGAFRAHIQHYREERIRYARIGIIAMIVTVISALLPIIAVIRITPKEQRWTQSAPLIDFDSVTEPAPPVGGIHWLKRHSKTQWMAKWFEKAFYVLFGLLCLISVLIYLWSCEQPWPVEEGGLSGTDRLGLLLLLTRVFARARSPTSNHRRSRSGT